MHTPSLRFLTTLLLAASLAHTAAPTVVVQTSNTTSRLQAVSPVTDRVVWASGTHGTYVITTDGGEHWHAGVVPGADSLEFRDVAALDSTTACSWPRDRARSRGSTGPPTAVRPGFGSSSTRTRRRSTIALPSGTRIMASP